MDQGQLEPESMERRAPVFALGAPLGRLGTDPRGPVGQDHRGLDLVAILAARSASPSGSKLALPGEHSGSRAAGWGLWATESLSWPAWSMSIARPVRSRTSVNPRNLSKAAEVIRSTGLLSCSSHGRPVLWVRPLDVPAEVESHGGRRFSSGSA